VRRLDLLVPTGFDDSRHPSGGNRYDREIAAALTADGWNVRTIQVGARTDGVPPTEPYELMGPASSTLVDGLLLEDRDTLQHLLPSDAVPLLHMPPSDRPALLDLLSRAPAVVTTSASTREHLLDLLAGRPAPTIVVAPPAVERTRTVDVFPSGQRLRCVAALLPNKGQDLLIAALAHVRDLDWRCELVGATDLAPRYVAALREQAKRLGIADRVVFAGAWNPDPVVRLYEGCDVLVLPSRAEGYGMVIAEAICCGVPVIASDTGGTREAMGGIRSARPGLLVRPGDSAELARALRGWLSSRGMRLDLTAAARARSAHARTWRTTARTIADALHRSVLGAQEVDHVAR
jgi:glycosyltransferase involved in cell wall biosynthesis